MGRDIGTYGTEQPSGRVLIVGGGVAGSLLALVLGRAGRDVVVFDAEPQPAVAIETLDRHQRALLRRLGVMSCFGTACPDMAAALRAVWPAHVRLVEAAIEGVEPSEWLQQVQVAGGERFLGRLLVLTTGSAGVAAPQAGLVTIGDAADLTRVFSEVRLLSRTYLPRWLVTPGMHRRKVAAFYAEGRKRGADAVSRAAT